jgi:hypothetical protein
MLKRCGLKALEESRTRIDELAAAGDHDGADTWRRITAAKNESARAWLGFRQPRPPSAIGTRQFRAPTTR